MVNQMSKNDVQLLILSLVTEKNKNVKWLIIGEEENVKKTEHCLWLNKILTKPFD